MNNYNMAGSDNVNNTKQFNYLMSQPRFTQCYSNQTIQNLNKSIPSNIIEVDSELSGQNNGPLSKHKNDDEHKYNPLNNDFDNKYNNSGINTSCSEGANTNNVNSLISNPRDKYINSGIRWDIPLRNYQEGIGNNRTNSLQTRLTEKDNYKMEIHTPLDQYAVLPSNIEINSKKSEYILEK